MRQSGYFAYTADPRPERGRGGGRIAKTRPASSAGVLDWRGGHVGGSSGGRRNGIQVAAIRAHPPGFRTSRERNDGQIRPPLVSDVRRAAAHSASALAAAIMVTLVCGTGAARTRRARCVGAWRLADPLRHPARRPGRAMRPDPERHGGGSAQYRPDRDHPEDRRQEKSRIMRVIAPPGVLLPSGLGLKVDNAESAGPASCAACRTAASPRS